MEGASELLHRMYESLHLHVCELKHLREGLRLVLEHLERDFDHVLLDLVLDHLDLADGLIVGFKDGLVLVLGLPAYLASGALIHSLLCKRSVLCDSIHVVADLSEHFLLVLIGNFVEILDFEGYHPFLTDHHEYVLELPGTNQGLEVHLLVLEDVVVLSWVCAVGLVLFQGELVFGHDVGLEGLTNHIDVLH